MEEFKTLVGQDIEAAKIFLSNGLLVGIPTETVYGLAGNALSEDAILKIYNVKQRPHFDPLILHTHSLTEIEKYTIGISDKARQLVHRFMPGPLTLLLQKKLMIPDIMTSGLETVAVRIPNHPLTLELLKQLPFPLAAPSANPFGYISPTTAQHVYNQLQCKIPYILDGGPSLIGIESTIIGFEGETPVVYRLGGLAVEEIEDAVGRVKINVNSASDPKTPGMLKSHYAPKKQLVFNDETELKRLINEGKKIAVIAFDEPVKDIDLKHQTLLSNIGNIEEAATALFAVMRMLDATDADVIYAVKFPEETLGRAINDRLQRASVKE